MSKAIFQKENASQVFDEAMPLLRAHYNEVAHFPDLEFDPDKDHYIALDNAGLTRFFTARNSEGALIGYANFIVKFHAHHKSSKQAFQDVIYIKPEERGFGAEFISWCDDQLQLEGCAIVYHFVKKDFNWGSALERIGYKCVELLYARKF